MYLPTHRPPVLSDAGGALCERDARQIDMITAQVVAFAWMKAG